MSWIRSPWTMPALAGLLVLVPLAVGVLGGRSARTTPGPKAAWLVAATTSGTVLVLVAAKVTEVLPHATVVDVGALAVTGVMTGLFLALGLSPARSGAAS